MTEDPARATDTPPHKPRRSRAYIYLALLVPALALPAYLGWTYLRQSDRDLPQSVIAKAPFAVYYPEQLPSPYELDKKSAVSSNGILFYKLSSNGKEVTVSQQQMPNPRPDTKAIKDMNSSFKDISTPSGEAIAGVSADKAVGILLTNTTLVTINGTKDVPQDVIAEITESMRSIN